MFVALSDAPSDGTSGWMHVAPEGSWEGHPSGAFELTRADFEAIVERYAARKSPAMVDFDHRSLNETGTPEDTEAAGWVEKLELRDEPDGSAGLWAFVDWVPETAEKIRAGKYRFCSPVIDFESIDRESGEVVGVELFNVALTGNPFLDGQHPIALSRRGMNMNLTAADTARANAALKLNVLDALKRVAAEVDEDAEAYEVTDKLYQAMEQEQEKSAIREVLVEAGVISADSPAEAPAAAMGDKPEDEVPMAAEPGDSEEDDAVAMADGEGEDGPAEGLGAQAQTLLEGIASAAGVDTAAALAALIDQQDDLAEMVRKTLETDGTPAEGVSMSDKPTKSQIAELKADADAASIRALSAKIQKLEAAEAERVKADAVALKREVKAVVEAKIADGYIHERNRKTAEALCLSNRPAFDDLYGEGAAKLATAGEQAFQKGTHAAAKGIKLSDLPPATRRLAQSFINARVAGGNTEACIEKALAQTETN